LAKGGAAGFNAMLNSSDTSDESTESPISIPMPFGPLVKMEKNKSPRRFDFFLYKT
jgi:hypothetical protein